MKNIYVAGERVFDFTISLFYPYITEFIYSQNPTNNIVFAECNNVKYKIKCLTIDDNHRISKDDTFFISDGMVQDFESHRNIIEQFDLNRVVSFFCEGEAYQITPNILNFLDNGGRILTSFLKSKEDRIGDDVTPFFNHKNVYSSFISSFYNFNSKTQLKFLNNLSHTNLELKQSNFDISLYTRYGYKPWRDIFTDTLRDSYDKLNVNEVSSFISFKDGKKYKVENFEDVKNFGLNYNASHSLFHGTYFFDMADSDINIVYETSMEESTIFITEKTYKEYLFGFLFYGVMSNTIRKFLKQYGFYSLDMDDYNIDISKKYEDISNTFPKDSHKNEYLRFVRFITFLSSLSKNELKSFIEKNNDKAKNNKKIIRNLLFNESKGREQILKFIL